MSYQEIVDIVGVSQSTISGYIKKFREKGLIGLKMSYSTGRPSKLSKDQELTIYETIINEFPKDYGFNAKMNWTCAHRNGIH